MNESAPKQNLSNCVHICPVGRQGEVELAKFIHTADWQLGMTRHFLEGEAQARYTQARFDVVRGIAALATNENCDFVIVSGDVFESNLLDKRVIVRSLDALIAFSVPVFL